LKPTVLVATTSRWPPTARLAVALANAGFNVEAVCPPRHPLMTTKAAPRPYIYRGLAPLLSFKEAIRATKPDLIVPGDDLATQHLHGLYRREQDKGESGSKLMALIEKSLGSPASFPIVYARTPFMEMAHSEGVRVPATQVIANIAELTNCCGRIGFPMVLKANGTSGGDGVRIVHTAQEAESAFRTLQAPPLLARAAKRALADHDRTLLWPSLLRRRSAVNAQTYIAGHEATSLVACWKGEVLAALHLEVLNKQHWAGPATVLRLIEGVEMQAAAEKTVRRLGLSGLHGFDFMLEAGSGDAYLLEVNPRATQVGHLTLGPGRDLPAALYAAVTGKIVQDAPRITDKDIIALFPQEWTRDPASPILEIAYHDVPWDEPELIQACVRGRKKGVPRNFEPTKSIHTFSEPSVHRL
jgi:Carbamoyl-phosphate synthase L chain, ATP binding domain